MAVKRIPLTGAYNTRPVTGALSSTTGVIGIGVIGVMVIGEATAGSTKDHRMINCVQITEIDQTSQSKRLYVVKRPGFAVSLTPAAGNIGSAIHVWTGQGTGQKLMTCFGPTNSTLYDGITSKGAITGKATAITETSISGTATLTISSTDSTAWYYQDGGTATKITDADYPGNASRTTTGPLVHLDGYAFQMDTTGRIYNSDLNSVTAWTAAAYITANSVPDVGVAAWRHRSNIIGFCKTHLDVFRNAGNPAGSILSRVDEMSQLIGCASADAICSVRDSVYFAGTTDGANLAIYSFNSGQVQKVSTSEIESALAIAGPGACSLTSLGIYGRHFVVVMASTSTYAYCVEEQVWIELLGQGSPWYKAAGLQAGTSIVNYTISKNITSGKVYVLNPAAMVYRDDGNVYTATVQTGKWDGGNSGKKTAKRIAVVGDQQIAASSLGVSWFDDDYQTPLGARTVDLADPYPNLTRCGRFRRRAFILSHSANTPMRLEALDIELEAGAT